MRVELETTSLLKRSTMRSSRQSPSPSFQVFGSLRRIEREVRCYLPRGDANWPVTELWAFFI